MNVTKAILVLFILIGAFFLRLHNYAVYPQRGATSDEYTYSFLGVSLLTKGIPISWSHFGAYRNKEIINIQKINFPIVSPYFDHPPLFGLLVGGWSLMFGQDTFEKVDLKTIRFVPIILSTISSLFVFLIGNRLYNFKIGIWALLIYSTTTFFILNSRVVVAENLLTPFFLFSIYIYLSKKLSIRKIILLGVLGGLGIWTKVIGASVFLANALFLLAERYKWKMIAISTCIFLLFVAAFIGYGFYFDKDLFWEVQGMQSERNIGPNTLWTYTLQALIVNKPYLNGWYFFGLFCLFFLFSDVKKHKAIIIPSFIYFFLLLLSLTQFGHSGWYMIPLYPFMSLAIAYVISEGIKKASWIIFLFAIYIGVSEMQYVYEPIFGLTSFQYRLFSVLLIAPFVASYAFRMESFSRFLGNFWFYAFIIGNIIATRLYMHPV